jgi:ABC transporter DrrB family efflux protein
MTTATLTPPAAGNPLTRMARDGGMIAWRNLLNIRRNPDMLMASTVQPIMFVLLFAYVFGGSIGNDPAAYRQYLMGGIFVQTVAFNSAFTTIGLANDLHKGIIDRFRALPMSRVAVILGRTTSDLAVSALSLLIMSLCGLIIGWRIHDGVAQAVGAYLVLLLFAFAMSWVGALIGLVSRSVEVAQSAGLIWIFPVTFISSAFVSANRMPAPLAAIAHWNPITALANSVRQLFGNTVPAGFPPPHGWPVDHAVLYAVLWSVAIVAVFLPLAAARYRRAASR